MGVIHDQQKSGANMDTYTDEILLTCICKISIPISLQLCYIYLDVSVIVGGEQGGQQGTDPAWQAYYAQYYGQYQQQQQQGGQPGQPAQSAAPTSQANPATPAATAAAGGQAAGGQPSQYNQ